MKPPSGIDDRGRGVARHETRAEEHPPNVDVIGDVAARHIAHRHTMLRGEDFHGHRRLLLADAGKALETCLEHPGGRFVVPNCARIPRVTVHDPPGDVTCRHASA